MIVEVSAVGVDDLLDLYNNFWGQTLSERVTPRLAVSGYYVTESQTIYSSAGILRDALPYRLDLTLDTGRAPADKASIRTAVTNAILQSVGAGPASIAFPGLGDARPAAPAPGLVDDIGNAATSVVAGVNLITIGLTIGALALIYILVVDPSKGAKALRAVRL